MNIVELIRQETRLLSGRTAVVEGPRSITYGDLLDRIGKLRDRLANLGITAGQRVAFRCSDGIDYVIGALGLLECGAAVVPVADSLTEGEVARDHRADRRCRRGDARGLGQGRRDRD